MTPQPEIHSGAVLNMVKHIDNQAAGSGSSYGQRTSAMGQYSGHIGGQCGFQEAQHQNGWISAVKEVDLAACQSVLPVAQLRAMEVRAGYLTGAALRFLL